MQLAVFYLNLIAFIFHLLLNVPYLYKQTLQGIQLYLIMILLLLTNNKTYDRMKAWNIAYLTIMCNR